MARPEQIQDERLRTLVNEARDAYRGGNATESVYKSVEALLSLMEQQPGFIQMQRAPGAGLRVGRIWPPLGVKVEMTEDQPPKAVYERDMFSSAEAITFYEFALDSLVAANL
jgi:hypothetical protein